MPFFRATEGDKIVAEFRVNGRHHVTYKNVIVPRPLISTPLRNRNLDPSIFAGPKLKIERARRLIQDLQSELDSYLKSTPIESHVVAQPDGVTSYGMRITTPLPEVVSAIAGDAIHNLRSALDLMVCDLVRQNGSDPTRANSYPTSQKGFADQVRGVSAKAEGFLARIRASSRQNEAVLVLHQLDIQDKHNRVLAVTGATVGIYTRVGIPFISWGATPDDAIPFPGSVGMPSGVRNVFLTDEMVEVYRTSPWVEEQVRIRICPVLASGLPAEGEPLMDMLQLFGGLVERIVTLAERRLSMPHS